MLLPPELAKKGLGGPAGKGCWLSGTTIVPPAPPPMEHFTAMLTLALIKKLVAGWMLFTNLKLYPPETQSPGMMWERFPSMLPETENVLPPIPMVIVQLPVPVLPFLSCTVTVNVKVP